MTKQIRIFFQKTNLLLNFEMSSEIMQIVAYDN
jgi:hypothetical protein